MSTVTIDKSDVHDLKVTPEGPTQSDGKMIFNTEELVNGGTSNLVVSVNKKNANKKQKGVHATRYIVGHGEESGDIVVKLANDVNKPVVVSYLDVVPWYLRVFFHTLRVVDETGRNIPVQQKKLSPARDRSKPYSIELVLTLPPKSVTKISFHFEKSILKWLEYPPDANHGFSVGPAIIGLLEDDSPEIYYIFTETLLVNLPTPDFSMPYNVICLACTVVAMVFSPLHNVTTGEMVLEKKTESKSLLGKATDFVKGIFSKKKAVEEVQEVPSEEFNEEDEANE